MKHIAYILIAFVFSALISCGKQQSDSDSDSRKSIDLSLFYRVESSDKCIYDAHRKVPLGEKVTLADLDNLFGEHFVCDTTLQTLGKWSLYEQEWTVERFLPTEAGDTLIMMRRIYGEPGDWMIWINLEVQESDSLRVLNFLAYDNSRIDM